MAKKNKYSVNSSEFHDYFEGKLSNRERNAFERKMQKDLFNMDAAEGFSMVTREEAEEDLARAGKKIRQRITLRRRIGWYSAAATLAAILTITTIFLTVDNDPDSQDKRIREMNKSLESTYVGESKSKKADEVSDEKVETKEETPGEAEAAPGESDKEERITQDNAEKDAVIEEAVAEEVDVVFEATADEEVAEETIIIEEREEEAINAIMENIGEGAGINADQAEVQEFSMDIAEDDEAEVNNDAIQGIPEAAVAVKRDVSSTAGYVEATPTSTEKSTRAAKGRNVANEQVEEVSEVIVSMEAPAPTVQQAVPVNGMTAFMVYVDSSLVFPAAELSRSSAAVDLSFYIMPDGRPDNIQIISSPSNAFSEEARRVITNGPRWTPASSNGVYSNSPLDLTIEFMEKHKK